ncbi:MAG: electron transfer flavoprotein-ubiquinone oxidoreductase [Planctomycetota bacterium]|nr:electron transfer flavoprotein-ubiquinone oxidoreductase [Planctomycetota bacterium]
MADEREVLDVDVLFVGAGPAGLAGALHLKNKVDEHNALAAEKGEPTLDEPMIAVIEKADNVGAHTISGAVVDPRSLDELIPDWREQGAPVVPVRSDEMKFLTRGGAMSIPHPPWMKNHGFSTGSLNNLVRWLAERAEAAEINVFPGFPASELIIEDEVVKGVTTNDKGVSASGERKANFEPGVEIRAPVTVLCDGSRGHLTKRLVQHFGMEGPNPQEYETGVKETWEVPGASAQAGRVIHTMGWPLGLGIFGGSFIYYIGDDLITLGLVVGLDTEDPTMDIHEEFQRFKTHPFVSKLLEGGTRVHYGAKSLPAGGYWSMPRAYADGALLAGDSLGTLNAARLKGIHAAMKSGMLAAETALEALVQGRSDSEVLSGYESALKDSWLGKELYRFRNFHQAVSHGLGPSAVFHVGLQMLTGGRGVRDRYPSVAGHERMRHKGEVKPRHSEPFKPDGKLTFDKLTNVFFSGTKHEEDQPCHLVVHADAEHCSVKCAEEYGNPCQYFCPAAVYEMVPNEADQPGDEKLQVNFSNCVHCKTCDIMDPYQVIEWVTPEGGGPAYVNL